MTNNAPFQNYPYLEDYTIQLLILLGSSHDKKTPSPVFTILLNLAFFHITDEYPLTITYTAVLVFLLAIS